MSEVEALLERSGGAFCLARKKFLCTPKRIRKAADIRRQWAERTVHSGWGETLIWKETQCLRFLSTAIVAGLLFGITAPAFAADPPKTKTECAKLSDMKWDATTKACVKK